MCAAIALIIVLSSNRMKHSPASLVRWIFFANDPFMVASCHFVVHRSAMPRRVEIVMHAAGDANVCRRKVARRRSADTGCAPSFPLVTCITVPALNLS
jgi:hypothetical protein